MLRRNIGLPNCGEQGCSKKRQKVAVSSPLLLLHKCLGNPKKKQWNEAVCECETVDCCSRI